MAGLNDHGVLVADDFQAIAVRGARRPADDAP